MTRVLTFGESMAALHGEGPLRLAGGMQLSIAGTESNVAIGLARLGHQAEWIGRLGDDELGRLVLRTLRAENVDVSHVIVDGSAPTGLLLFEHRIADITNVSYYRAGSAGSGICADDVAHRLTDDVAALHVTGVTAALGNTAAEAIAGCVEIARRRGIPVSLDVNFRSRLWSAATARDTLRPLVSQVEILFGSEDEVMLVAADGSTDIDTAAQQIIADGTGTVVVKRGGAGATAYTIDGKLNVPGAPRAGRRRSRRRRRVCGGLPLGPAGRSRHRGMPRARGRPGRVRSVPHRGLGGAAVAGRVEPAGRCAGDDGPMSADPGLRVRDAGRPSHREQA